MSAKSRSFGWTLKVELAGAELTWYYDCSATSNTSMARRISCNPLLMLDQCYTAACQEGSGSHFQGDSSGGYPGICIEYPTTNKALMARNFPFLAHGVRAETASRHIKYQDAPVLDPEKKVERQLRIPCSKTVYIIFLARVLTLKTFDDSGVLESAKRQYAQLLLPDCIVISFVTSSEATPVHPKYLLRRTGFE